MRVGTASACGTASGRKRRWQRQRPSCEKTKTVYYQKQNMKNPLTQERYVVYDLLGTNEDSVKNVSSKAVISNVKIEQFPYQRLC